MVANHSVDEQRKVPAAEMSAGLLAALHEMQNSTAARYR